MAEKIGRRERERWLRDRREREMAEKIGRIERERDEKRRRERERWLRR